jgi:predicted AAA+ superfamily ATPase
MWIPREITASLQASNDPIQIIRGPRQCGKSSLLLRLAPDFTELSLDDPALRDLAQRDPELFLNSFPGQRLLIDEAQYAPALFPSLKRRVDLAKRVPGYSPTTVFRLTGSNQILMDRQVKESLAGRASYFDMNTLSVSEILRARSSTIQDILFRGGWHELHAYPDKDAKRYLDDYINSYVEKDIVLAAGIQKSGEFLKFVRLLAGRVGEIVDYASLGNDADVDGKTIKEWLSILERMHVIALVPPFASNLSTRLIKSPKVYFIDTGLACRLQGWTSPQQILTTPQQGLLFENLVFSEIYKCVLNHQKDWRIYHWRSRAGEEVDFLLEIAPGKHLFIEAKVSARDPQELSRFPEIKKVFGAQTPESIVCHQEGERILNRRVPIAQLSLFLLETEAALEDKSSRSTGTSR